MGVTIFGKVLRLNRGGVTAHYIYNISEMSSQAAMMKSLNTSSPGWPTRSRTLQSDREASALLAQYGSLEEIPSEEFRTYSAANIKTLAAKVKRVREDNKWSISKCKKEFGTAWAKIEQGEKVTLNAEQVRKLTRAFDISGYLIFDDYYHRALTWKRIVRLPYGDGQPTI